MLQWLPSGSVNISILVALWHVIGGGEGNRGEVKYAKRKQLYEQDRSPSCSPNLARLLSDGGASGSSSPLQALLSLSSRNKEDREREEEDDDDQNASESPGTDEWGLPGIDDEWMKVTRRTNDEAKASTAASPPFVASRRRVTSATTSGSDARKRSRPGTPRESFSPSTLGSRHKSGLSSSLNDVVDVAMNNSKAAAAVSAAPLRAATSEAFSAGKSLRRKEGSTTERPGRGSYAARDVAELTRVASAAAPAAAASAVVLTSTGGANQNFVDMSLSDDDVDNVQKRVVSSETVSSIMNRVRVLEGETGHERRDGSRGGGSREGGGGNGGSDGCVGSCREVGGERGEVTAVPKAKATTTATAGLEDRRVHPWRSATFFRSLARGGKDGASCGAVDWSKRSAPAWFRDELKSGTIKASGEQISLSVLSFRVEGNIEGNILRMNCCR